MASLLATLKDKITNDPKTAGLYAIGTIGLIVSSVYINKLVANRKHSQKMKEFEDKSSKENKIILHGAAADWSVPTPTSSPACSKMIAFFNYTKIPFEIDTTMVTHPKTKKMPWITYKNRHIPDSNMIIKYIKNESSLNNIDIDSHLNELQKSVLIAYKSMIEDTLYFIIAYRRWMEQENANKYLPIVFEKIPVPKWIISYLIGPQILKSVKNQTFYQGISRLPRDDIYKKGVDVVKSVLVYRGDNKFFFNDKLTTLDLTIYAHIGSMYQVPLKWYGEKDELPNKKEINEYMKNIEIECYGELKYWKDIV